MLRSTTAGREVINMRFVNRFGSRVLVVCAASAAILASAVGQASAGPGLKVSPWAAEPGSTVKMSGNLLGYGVTGVPSEPVRIYFDKILAGNSATDWYGNFIGRLAVPHRALSGWHSVTAVGASSRRSVSGRLLVVTLPEGSSLGAGLVGQATAAGSRRAFHVKAAGPSPVVGSPSRPPMVRTAAGQPVRRQTAAGRLPRPVMFIRRFR